MAKLLSGKTLRSGGSGQYITLKGSQPQLPANADTSTGYTIVTNNKLVTSYRSSLGNLEMHSGTVYNNIPDTPIVFIGTGTGNVQVRGTIMSNSTDTGALTVQGGLGIGGNFWTGEDIHVNGLLIGQGLKNLDVGSINNIVIQGAATEPSNPFPIGQENIVIGYDTLVGLDTAYKNIAIGRYAISSGTQVQNTIAIGDSALKNIGTYHYIFAANITNISSATPVVVTAAGHGLSTGTQIVITDVLGSNELIDNYYYIKVLTPSTFALYSDIILNQPVNGSLITAYGSGGKVNYVTVWNDNVAIGTNAGLNLINGQENFFLGFDIASNLTTGSYNFFMGHGVGGNMKQGNANISIGGDNLIDGLDNQINIGSMLYYNGGGYTQMNTDLGVGFGTTATEVTFSSYVSNITKGVNTIVFTSGAHGLVSGQSVSFAGVLGMLQLNTASYFAKVLYPDRISLYTDQYLNTPLDSSGYDNYAGGGIVYLNELIAAVSVLGGVAISENLIVKHDMTVHGNIYGASLAVTKMVINPVVPPTQYYLGLTTATNSVSPIYADSVLTYDTTDNRLTAGKLAVTSTATSTSTTTGALTVAGGVGIGGAVYSADGNPQENYLLYTPRVTITDTGRPPADARVGDFWVDSVLLVQFQYIKDDTSTFWIQVNTL
jgi:hypothetical protein